MTQTPNDAAAPEPAAQPVTQQEPQPQGFATPDVQPQGFAAPYAPPQGSVTPDAQPQGFATERKPRRRLGSGKLFAGALVLGVLGGVGTGYAVQATRPPTPLPSLAGTQPKYQPAGVYQGIAPAQLPASQDDATRTDGDLTKLLLPKPAGAGDADSTWTDQMIGVAEDAYLCDDQSQCYEHDYQEGIEAVADTQWTTHDGYFVEIRMFRFRPGQSGSAQTDESQYSNDGSTTIPMPAGIEASGYEFRDSYGDNADVIYAIHGDILVTCWVSSPTKIPNPSVIDGVVTQQMARL